MASVQVNIHVAPRDVIRPIHWDAATGGVVIRDEHYSSEATLHFSAEDGRPDPAGAAELIMRLIEALSDERARLLALAARRANPPTVIDGHASPV